MTGPNNALNDGVLTTLKTVDPDRYRAGVFADPQARARLMTLYGFHAELAKVPELVSEPMIGAIRYQWWRDAVDEIYTKDYVRKHEISTPLRQVLQGTNAPRFWVDQLIDGRERDLDPRPFEDLSAAKDYCAQTSGKLLQIAVHICAPDIRLSADQTDGVSAAGLSWGLTGLARAYGYYHKSMLSNLTADDLITAAQQAHQEARERLGKIAPEIMPALAYCALVPGFLKRLRAIDPVTTQVNFGGLSKRMVLMKSVLRGRV